MVPSTSRPGGKKSLSTEAPQWQCQRYFVLSPPSAAVQPAPFGATAKIGKAADQVAGRDRLKQILINFDGRRGWFISISLRLFVF